MDLIKYDALGWPAIPERLIGVWQVGVESVRAMEGDSIYLLPRCEDQILRVSDGPMEVALLAFQASHLGCSALQMCAECLLYADSMALSPASQLLCV